VPSKSKHRVLVVDDERAIRDVVDDALSQSGFEVRTAIDGADALTAVRDWSPECILLDVMMPKIDGLALIPLLRRLTEVPIVMLTARRGWRPAPTTILRSRSTSPSSSRAFIPRCGGRCCATSTTSALPT
jgi:DNA-binding NtrC family response regulator